MKEGIIPMLWPLYTLFCGRRTESSDNDSNSFHI